MNVSKDSYLSISYMGTPTRVHDIGTPGSYSG
jgi:hypothetical protein